MVSNINFNPCFPARALFPVKSATSEEKGIDNGALFDDKSGAEKPERWRRKRRKQKVKENRIERWWQAEEREARGKGRMGTHGPRSQMRKDFPRISSARNSSKREINISYGERVRFLILIVRRRWRSKNYCDCWRLWIRFSITFSQ